MERGGERQERTRPDQRAVARDAGGEVALPGDGEIKGGGQERQRQQLHVARWGQGQNVAAGGDQRRRNDALPQTDLETHQREIEDADAGGGEYGVDVFLAVFGGFAEAEIPV